MASLKGPAEASLPYSGNNKIPADLLNQIFRDLVDYTYGRISPQ